VGWDKDSLTKMQKKGKVIAIILIKRIYKARDTQCSFLTAKPPAHSQAAIPLLWPGPLVVSQA